MNNELLMVFKKESDISFMISEMLVGRGMRQKIVDRKILFDSLGGDEYVLVSSTDTDIERIINLLSKECLGR